MAASTPSEYIEHHLSFFTRSVGEGDFWSVNVDTMVMSLILGVLGLGFYWLARARRRPACPSKTRRSSSCASSFVNDQVKGIYHGESRWVAPIALTVFVWVC